MIKSVVLTPSTLTPIIFVNGVLEPINLGYFMALFIVLMTPIEQELLLLFLVMRPALLLLLDFLERELFRIVPLLLIMLW